MYRFAPAWSQRLLGVHAGVAQLVELQPSKLDVASSNLVARSKRIKAARKRMCVSGTWAHVAQSVERFLGKEEVRRFDSGRGLHFLIRRHVRPETRVSQ